MNDQPQFSRLIHTRRVAAILTDMGNLLRTPGLQDPEAVLEVLDLVESDLDRCRKILRPPPPERWIDPDTLPF